jgi:glycosyltransferase involved in cell wall biosynthesis
MKAPGMEANGNVLVHRYGWFDSRPILVSERLRMLELPFLFPGLFFATFLFLLRNHRRIDMIHCHGFVAGSIANLLSPIFRKPYVVSVHWVIGNERLGKSKNMLKRLLSKARMILTCSKTAAEEMAAVGFPRDRIRSFDYWVDLSRFRPEDKEFCKRSLGVQNMILVLYVGRLIEAKGIMTFLEIAKAFERREALMFAVIGTGTLDSKISEYCESHSNMVFFGQIPNERLPLYYNSADLVIVPSLQREGFPRVIVESLSSGTPVLASNIAVSDGLDEAVAVICDPDFQSIATKLGFLLDNPRFLESLASGCRDFSTHHFGVENARIIEEAYIAPCTNRTS